MPPDISVGEFQNFLLVCFVLLCVILLIFGVIYLRSEKVELLIDYLQNGRNGQRTAAFFNAMHPERHVHRNYVRRLFQKFQLTGSVNRKPGSGRQSSELNEIVVLGQNHVNPRQSLRDLESGLENSIHYTTIRKIFKRYKIKPFKMHISQELGEGDFDRRLQYCEIVEEKLTNDPNFLRKICFSNESCFFLDGKVNTQNCRYWSLENPRELRESKSQYPQKFNAWAGIFRRQIVGPFFYQENLNGENYLRMLTEQIVPALRQICEEEEFAEVQEEPIQFATMYFQQDGAPAHSARDVRDFLNTVFLGRWIGRRGPIEWPPRSPDMTPLDFFLWGHLKSVVFKTKPESLQDLQDRVTEACRAITREQLENVHIETEHRLYFCQERDGRHFEHLL